MMLEGRKIVEVRPMTAKEVAREGWDSPATVLVLDDGSLLYASRDEEGNGSGALFGITADGDSVSFSASLVVS